MVPNPPFFELKFPLCHAYNKVTKREVKTNRNFKIQTAKGIREVTYMFFKSKKEKTQKAETAPAVEKKELLYRENIHVNCEPMTKKEAILAAGKMLVETGYVEPEYAEAMLEREKTCSTFMGNGLALPHGVEAAKKRVLQSGISVQTFKEPIDWDGNPVRIVIGIAGVGDAHLDILAQIAEAMLDEEVSANIADYDADKIYKVLTGKE